MGDHETPPRPMGMDPADCGRDDDSGSVGGGDVPFDPTAMTPKARAQQDAYDTAMFELNTTLDILGPDSDLVDWAQYDAKPMLTNDVIGVRHVIEKEATLTYLCAELLNAESYPNDRTDEFIDFLVSNRIESIHEVIALTIKQFNNHFNTNSS